MGKKRRRHPTLEELLDRAWCYYCERDFEDLKLLISHQKAKHFKCDRCGRRLNTAGGLSVHMNQVHKESLSSVDNALSDRQGLDVEIFGMEGIPEDVIQRHNQHIIQNYYQAQADRQTATGNPPSGAGSSHSRKKLKFETHEELKARLHEYVTRRRTEKTNPTQVNPPFAATHGQPGYTPGAFPPQYSSATAATGSYNAFPASNLPARPGAGAPSALPQRPPQYDSAAWTGVPGTASTVNELVNNAANQGDGIDQMIRLAESGAKLAKTDETPAEKKKKDKNRMVFTDVERSPEEILCARY